MDPDIHAKKSGKLIIFSRRAAEGELRAAVPTLREARPQRKSPRSENGSRIPRQSWQKMQSGRIV